MDLLGNLKGLFLALQTYIPRLKWGITKSLNDSSLKRANHQHLLVLLSPCAGQAVPGIFTPWVGLGRVRAMGYRSLGSTAQSWAASLEAAPLRGALASLQAVGHLQSRGSP